MMTSDTLLRATQLWHSINVKYTRWCQAKPDYVDYKVIYGECYFHSRALWTAISVTVSPQAKIFAADKETNATIFIFIRYFW